MYDVECVREAFAVVWGEDLAGWSVAQLAWMDALALSSAARICGRCGRGV